jgi:hypothetical protein
VSNLVKAESLTVSAALESSIGVAPTSGWRQLQPDPGGIQDFYPQFKKVAISPLSKNRMPYKSEPVDLDTAPKIVQHLSKDLLDIFSEGCFLAKTKHPGGTGLSYFTPTAFTATTITVATLGALQQNTLLFVRGAKQAANNGLRAVGAASTGTSITVTGGAAETVSGYYVTAEVAGWRGASGDIGIDVNGNITSTVADFTTMGLVPGMFVWVGGTAGTANAFATAAYRGLAQILTVAAHLVTLQRRSWAIGAADTGATKTIDLYFGRWLRNVAFDDTDYIEPSWSLELSLPGADVAGATDYAYARGSMVTMLEVDAPLTSLITATVSFVGLSMTDPTTARDTGAATAALPLAYQGMNSAGGEFVRPPRITDPNNVTAGAEAIVCQDVSSWKLSINNNVKGQKQQGFFGSARMIVGKCNVGVDLVLFYVQPDSQKAIRDNRQLRFDVGIRNNDGGVVFDVPAFNYDGGSLDTPANDAVTLSSTANAFPDAIFNYEIGMTLFAYLPAS